MKLDQEFCLVGGGWQDLGCDVFGDEEGVDFCE